MRAFPLVRMRDLAARYQAAILGAAGVAMLLALWEVTAHWSWINPLIVSRPSAIAEAFQRQWSSGELLRHIGVSVTELAVGFVPAVLAGFSLGVAMGLRRDVEYALHPFIWVMYSVPLVAFYPVIIVWLGFGFQTVVAMVFVLSIIPVAVNTLAGIRAVNPLLVRVVRAFGGHPVDVAMKVILPAALPMTLAGMRLAVGRALVGVVLGEMFSANAGLGFLMTYYGARLRIADLFVPLVVLMFLGVTAIQTLRAIEESVAPWIGS